MYDLSAPLSPPEKPSVPWAGILSCAAAVIAGLLSCGGLALAYWSPVEYDGSSASSMNLLYGLLALCGSSGLGALLGTVLSIAAIVPLERRKVWGDVGLVLNGTILLGYCGVIGLLVLALLSGQP